MQTTEKMLSKFAKLLKRREVLHKQALRAEMTATNNYQAKTKTKALRAHKARARHSVLEGKFYETVNEMRRIQEELSERGVDAWSVLEKM